MTRRIKTAAPPTTNLLNALPAAAADEIVDLLAAADGVRLERIISHGQASPDGFWYDQAQAEWVLVLAGRAGLRIEHETTERVLEPGDSVWLPPHCRHRMTWTDAERPTVWLALFLDGGRAGGAAPGGSESIGAAGPKAPSAPGQVPSDPQA